MPGTDIDCQMIDDGRMTFASELVKHETLTLLCYFCVLCIHASPENWRCRHPRCDLSIAADQAFHKRPVMEKWRQGLVRRTALHIDLW